MPWKKASAESQRRKLVEALLSPRQEVGVICHTFGVSRQTAYKFLRRFKAEGRIGLKDRSRRPHVTCGAQATQWRRRVLQLRRTHPTWGSRKLRWLLRRRFGTRSGPLPAERTLQRWIAAAGLRRETPVQRRRAQPAAAVKASIAYRSNAVWTIDLKGWFTTSNGTKVEPLTIRDLWSRFVLWARSLAPRNEAAVRRVCRRLFRRYGRPKVIRCDLGAPFYGDGPGGFTRLSLWWWRLGIRVEFVRRGIINNNAHEQMHGVMKAELAVAHTASAQARRLERWRHRYNHDRPHDGLGMRVPAHCYRSRPGPLPSLRMPSYSSRWLVRQVDRGGAIALPHWRGSIGRTFGGLRVGLAPAGPRRFRVYFANLFLGTLDLNVSRKLSITRY
jgi:putative transposase